MEENSPEVHKDNLSNQELIFPYESIRFQSKLIFPSDIDVSIFTQHELNTRKQYVRRRLFELLCEARKIESTNWMFPF